MRVGGIKTRDIYSVKLRRPRLRGGLGTICLPMPRVFGMGPLMDVRFQKRMTSKRTKTQTSTEKRQSIPRDGDIFLKLALLLMSTWM